MAHFERLFRDEMRAYVSVLVAKTRPRAVIVCMLYYLLEGNAQRGFADATLQRLGYDSDPSFLQGIIQEVFECAVKSVSVEGTEVIPLPLFQVLDSRDPSDYLCRVE